MKVAIDGPAGAGKSTVARSLARELGYVYIDTGAMYRALTLKALQKGIPLGAQTALVKLAQNTHIHFEYRPDSQRTICDGQDVSNAIRSPEVSEAVSTVAAYPAVRQIMVKEQRGLAEGGAVVMDGRDIGTCVLPDADFKFYLTASLEERSRRRLEEMRARGYEPDLARIKAEIRERDEKDSSREVGALAIQADSIVIDTSELSVDQVVDTMLAVVRETGNVL